MRSPTLAIVALLALVPALRADAQVRRAPVRDTTSALPSGVPRAMLPPAGKCRVWMKGVPAAQQPAPTDCTTALRQTPANGVVVFGPSVKPRSPFETRDPRAAAAEPSRTKQVPAGGTSIREARPTEPPPRGTGRPSDPPPAAKKPEKP